jgi:uncharacterized Zn-finger protein
MGFAAKATLQEHSRVCQNQSGKESQHECPECGKVFSRQGQLTLHLKAHTGKELTLWCSCSNNPPVFMEPEGSLTCSQDPTTGPYPEPD